VPINPADLKHRALLHVDGGAVKAEDLPLARAWREGTPQEATFFLPRVGSVPHTLFWTAAPLRGEEGAVVGVSATAVLVSPEPDWEELAGLAHDLRTPLQALRLLIPILQPQCTSSQSTELLQRLGGSLDQIQAIARELLEWCRGPMQGKREISRDWVSLEPVALDAIAAQRLAAQRKDIQLVVNLSAASGVQIRTDRSRLGRLFANLLTNAVCYTSDGQVSLTASWRGKPEDPDQVLVLAVEDTGAGMGAEEQESIFQPFQRGRAGQGDTDSGNSGVGLATVDRLVGELGLTLEVFSTAGQGSRFELLVPRDMVRQQQVADRR